MFLTHRPAVRKILWSDFISPDMNSGTCGDASPTGIISHTSTRSMFRILIFILLCLAPLSSAGVRATYSQGTKTVSQDERLPALFVPANGLPAPGLKAGQFSTSWEGELVVSKRQRLYFSFEGRGGATLTINGETVLEESGELGKEKSARLRLNAGAHPFELNYEAPSDGDAQFRLLWEERSFPTEPIPPSAFAMPEASPLQLAHHGRDLFARHLCSKCHQPSDGFGPHAMPELAHLPPILALTGDRLNEPWLAAWIANPSAFRPDTNMPRLVPDNETGRQEASDMAAYLIETFRSDTTPSAPQGDSQRGGTLYHQLACVSCHGTPGETSPSHGRVPLAHVGKKYQAGALADFLKDPARLAPHTRMPNFRLSDEEAADLASFLRRETSSSTAREDAPPPLKGDPVRGLQLIEERQCGACHAGLRYDTSALPSFEDIASHSWAETSCYEGPHGSLNLPKEAGKALEAFRTTHLSALRQDTPADYTRRQVSNLRCNACHSYDEAPALLASVHPESAAFAIADDHGEKLEQTIPSLTYLGEMLQPDYLASMLAGTVQPRPRPWLEARMPGFANHFPKQLAHGLAAQHGLGPVDTPDAPSDSELAEIGRDLISSEKGFGCTTCHGIGDQAPTAAFEVMGINFEQTHERLRKDFFHQWMHDPTRITPGTKMPKYADNKGETNLPALDHEAEAQFEAIWQFLNASEK
ncbi:MAG: c-type cytochrome [Verrucomicrobiota bacterium JB023]|nr:c-type cytochrome [Verrucomicrobiota bacterium JB023]